jgi:sugar diacid utilization regulator
MTFQQYIISGNAMALTESTDLLNKSTLMISDQARQIEEMHSINRVQESWLRDCGFYGKEP